MKLVPAIIFSSIALLVAAPETLNATMTDVASAPSTSSAPASPKKGKKAGAAKKPAKPRTHPPAGDMVLAAVKALKDKKGSSLQAIKKYIAANYKCDVEKQSLFIRKYLKSAVDKKILVQTKGSGAAGSFKLPGDGDKKPAAKVAKKKTAAAKKPAVEKKPKKKAAAAKKPASPKKPKTTAAKKPKSPSKAKKAGKAPAKPKAPKPKKTAASKAKPAAKK